MQHIALIMDGNRRWAKKRSLQPWLGHQHGAESVKRVVEFCLKKNIPYLSLYAFSLENFKRPEQERNFLFTMLTEQAEHYLPHFMEHQVKVSFIGERALFPEATRSTIEKLEAATASNKRLQMNLLFCYGSRQEIVHGIKDITKKVVAGDLTIDQISDDMVMDYLWTKGTPAPDIVIRTGGVKRLSNFLLYQAAYSEFYFLDCLWPDISHEHLEAAVAHFYETKRNFGI